MAECTKCGAALEEGAEFCVNCGEKIELEATDCECKECEAADEAPVKKSRFIGLTLVGILMLFVPVLLWFKWKDECPEKAEALLRGALIKASIIPIFGLLLFFVLRKDNPELAKPCLITAIVVVAIPVIISLIYVLVALIGIAVAAIVGGTMAGSGALLAPAALLI